MFDCISVMITVLAGAYPRMMLFFETRGVKSRLTSSGSAYFRGMSCVTTLSSGLAFSSSSRVWMFLVRASGDGMIFTISPALTVVNPFTSSTDSNTL